MANGVVETADLIEPWLYATLTGDTALMAAIPAGNVYPALTPEEIYGVYVTFAMLSLRDIRGIGTARIQVSAIYTVKAVAQTTSQDDLVPAARRIAALLDGAEVDFPIPDTSLVGHITCTRETTVSYAQVISDAGQTRGGGQSFYHLGFTWRIVCSVS